MTAPLRVMFGAGAFCRPTQTVSAAFWTRRGGHAGCEIACSLIYIIARVCRPPWVLRLGPTQPNGSRLGVG